MIHAFWWGLTDDLLEDRRKDDITITSILHFDHIKQIDSMSLWVSTVTDHRWRLSVVRKSVIHSAAPRVPRFVLSTLWHHLWSITELTHSKIKYICWGEDDWTRICKYRLYLIAKYLVSLICDLLRLIHFAEKWNSWFCTWKLYELLICLFSSHKEKSELAT